MITEVFSSILLMSAAGSVLSLLLLLLKPVTKRIFSPKWQYYIWITVLIVMILPVSFSLPPKPSELTGRHGIQATNEVTDNMTHQEQSEATVVQNVMPKVKTAPDIQIPRNMIFYLSALWILGAILVLTHKIIKYLLFLKVINKNSRADTALKNIRKRLTVRRTKMLDAPLIVGLFKPVLFLPDTEIKEDHLNYILMHELTHYRRHDLLYKWFAMLVSSVHWFNPLVYIVSKQIDEACEISCDFEVAANLSEQGKNSYMEMILDMLLNSENQQRLLTTQMASNKGILKRRFTMIKNMSKSKKYFAITGVCAAIMILCAAVFVSGLYNAKFVNSNKLPYSGDEVTGHKTNFLLIGKDEGERADSILLVSLDKNDNAISTLSIPRNTLIKTDNENIRISELYSAENGSQKTMNIIQDTLSVKVHYYAEVDLNVLEKVVDILGGIDFDVPVKMAYEDPYQNLHIDIDKGMQRLNGEQFRKICQYRIGYREGDIARIQMQQSLIKELIKQTFNSKNMDKAAKIFHQISSSIKTNYSLNDLQKDMKTLANINTADAINQFTLPGENKMTETSFGQLSTYLVNENETSDIVKKYFME